MKSIHIRSQLYQLWNMSWLYLFWDCWNIGSFITMEKEYKEEWGVPSSGEIYHYHIRVPKAINGNWVYIFFVSSKPSLEETFENYLLKNKLMRPGDKRDGDFLWKVDLDVTLIKCLVCTAHCWFGDI